MPGGKFHLVAVAAGQYVLEIAPDDGFEAMRFPLHVVGGAFAPIAIHLRPQEMNQTINVAAEATGVGLEARQQRRSGHRKQPDHRKVPVLDQDIVSTFTPFLANSAVGSKGITLVVDGIEMKGMGVSASAIKSVGINNDPYSAESRSRGKAAFERSELKLTTALRVFAGEWD
jgi:hypothetical protein